MNSTYQQSSGDNWCKWVIYAEISYQILFFAIGTPINLWNLVRDILLLRASRRSATVAGAGRTLHLGLHLTVSNLVVLCIYCVAKTAWQLTYFWYGGDLLCRLYKFFGSFAYHSWSNIIVVIAVDMWYCVRSPLKSWSSGNFRIKVWLGIAWASAALFASPQLALNGIVFVPKEYRPPAAKFANFSAYQCIFIFGEIQNLGIGYSLYHTLIIFYIPLILISVSYAGIRKSLTRKLEHRSKLQERRMALAEDPACSEPLMNQSAQNNPCASALQKSPPERNYSFPGVLENAADSSAPSPTNKFRNKFLPNRTNSAVSFKLQALNNLPVTSLQDSGRLNSITSTTSGRKGSTTGDSADSNTKKRLLRMTLAVVLSYVLCWAPYQIDALSRCICELLEIRTCASIFCKFEWLEGILILGACLNPFLYRFKAQTKGKTISKQALEKNKRVQKN